MIAQRTAKRFTLQGLRHYENQDMRQAIVYWSRAIVADPSNAFALYARGSAYLMQRKYQAALNDLKEAKQIYDAMRCPDDLALKLAQANTLLRETEEAIPTAAV